MGKPFVDEPEKRDAKLQRLQEAERADESLKRDLSFAELDRELREVPMTWIPALLATLVRSANRQSVFKDGGLVEFVAGVKAE